MSHSDYSPPSRNSANNDSLTGIIELALAKYLQNTDDMLPAQVIAYNRGANRAQVQIVISVVTTNAQIITRSQVASVPVFQYGGGGFVQSFPISPGDTGWLKANDRDISLWKQTLKKSPPNTYRKHTFEDGMFFPDTLLNGVTIAAEDVAHAVWQNYAGTVKIALWNDLIKILVPKGVGIGGTPNANAILDLQSTTKAFLLPRMTTVQKNAIPSPVDGMAVYDTTVPGLSVYTAGMWS